MGGPMHYTIDKLLLLKDGNSLSIEPKNYKKEVMIGDELIAFMTAHMGEISWKLGSTTQFGPHSFMLTMFPTKKNLSYSFGDKLNE